MAAPRNATVLDTCVFSNFAHVDRVELLAGLPRVATVAVVRDELLAGTGTHKYLERAVAVLDKMPVVTPDSPTQAAESQLLKTLDPGEAQALAVAEAVDGMFVSDDGDARTAAKRRDVNLTGSIGLLVHFVERDHLSAATADEYLKRWIDEAGFRAPARDIDVFLE